MIKKPATGPGYHLEGVAFGMTDGVICFLGIIIGVAGATQDLRLIIIAAIIGGIADAFGNSFGFIVSQLTERNVQLHSKVELGVEVRVHSKKEVWFSGLFSFIATIIALVILIVPFFFFSIPIAILSTFLIGVVTLFILGSYVGRISGANILKTGLTYAALGIIGAVVSYWVRYIENHRRNCVIPATTNIYTKNSEWIHTCRTHPRL